MGKMTRFIRYTEKVQYKYVLGENTTIQLPLSFRGIQADSKYFKLTKEGLLTIYKGYAWNGANIIPDTKRNLYPSLVHDCLYQLMREYLIPYTVKRQFIADTIFTSMCRKNGVPEWVCKTYMRALTKFGKKNSDPKNWIKTMKGY